MDSKKILFAIGAATIMILAVTMVPAVNSNEADIDEYITNTVEVKDQFQYYLDSLNEKALDYMAYNKDDCSHSLDTSVYEIYGQQECDDVPISITLSDKGVTSNSESTTADDSVEIIGETTYNIIYDENGNIYDVTIIVDGQNYSIRDIYDPINNCCFVTATTAVAVATTVSYVTPVAVTTSWIPFIGPLIAIIMVVVFVVVVSYYYYTTYHAETNEGTIEFDTEESIVDGIKVGKKDGRIVAVDILGNSFKLSEQNRLNDNNATKERDNYHFALKYDSYIYVFSTIISKSTAEKIMILPYGSINDKGIYNVYTCYQQNAYAICTMFGEPTLPELHSDHGDYAGYFMHYHTHDHCTPAHSFFYW